MKEVVFFMSSWSEKMNCNIFFDYYWDWERITFHISKLMDLVWKHVIFFLRTKICIVIHVVFIFSLFICLFCIYKSLSVQFQNWRVYRLVYHAWFWPFTDTSTITKIKNVNYNINIKEIKFSQLDFFLFVISCCFLFILPLTNCGVPQKWEDRSYPKCI